MSYEITAPVTLNIGPYWDFGNRGDQPFIIELDATPLAVLVQEAARGYRVYELLAIRRPGDILHYLRVALVEVVDAIRKSVEAIHQKDRDIEAAYPDGSLPFTRFDALFYWAEDDTTRESECWLTFRGKAFWRDKFDELFAWVKDAQQTLRLSPDPLIQHEIARIDSGEHARDYYAGIARSVSATAIIPERTSLPEPLWDVLSELISRDTVQSVSCPFQDYWLWHRLIEEQLRRSQRTGLTPEAAFTLNGPDRGLGPVPYSDWGGAVHIPYEGTCGADLFIRPGWRNTFIECDQEGGSLSDIFFYCPHPASGQICHYVLTQDDLGELNCATRRVITDDWILYESNQTYIPNPRCKPHLLKDYPNEC
jgi:hypothetical protein